MSLNQIIRHVSTDAGAGQIRLQVRYVTTEGGEIYVFKSGTSRLREVKYMSSSQVRHN